MSLDKVLQYATLTRPDTTYSVNKVCQFMAYLVVVKRILRYLKGTIGHEFHLIPFSPASSSSLQVFSNDY